MSEVCCQLNPVGSPDPSAEAKTLALGWLRHKALITNPHESLIRSLAILIDRAEKGSLSSANAKDQAERSTKGFSTYVKVETEPGIPMLLFCPKCGERHIDEGEFATKLHHTHACQECGMVWRPSIAATCGVQFLPGFKSEPSRETHMGWCALVTGNANSCSCDAFEKAGRGLGVLPKVEWKHETRGVESTTFANGDRLCVTDDGVWTIFLWKGERAFISATANGRCNHTDLAKRRALLVYTGMVSP